MAQQVNFGWSSGPNLVEQWLKKLDDQAHDAGLRKNFLDATRAPLATDDASQGFEAGSRWLWGEKEWIASAVTAGAARWVPTITRSDLVVNAKHFGDLATNARQAIETAMDYVLSVSPNGGIVELPAGTINIGYSGTTIGGRKIGLKARSNVTLRGQGTATRLRVADGANIDLIANDRFAGGAERLIENFFVEDMILDGNAANQSPTAVEGFNYRLWGFRDCGMRNVRSLNPNTWGIRIESGDGFVISDVVTRHGAESNSDGIHFVDVDNVVGGGLDCLSEGDDAFIIEATNKDWIENYAIAGLIVKAKLKIGAGGRGCMLLVDEDVRPDLRRGMRNIVITGLVAEGCRGPGIVLIGGDFEGCSISGVADACGTGLALAPGNPHQPGLIKNCSFDVLISRSTGQSMWVALTNGAVEDCQGNVDIVDPAPSVVPASLWGLRWEAEIRVNYSATSNRPDYAVNIGAIDSAIAVMTDGCAGGITIQGTATGNSIYPKRVKSNGGNAVNIGGGAANNSFHGGKVLGPIVNNAAAKFFGVVGAENYGSLTATTDASGQVSVLHGLNGIPASVIVTPHGGNLVSLRLAGRWPTDFVLQAVGASGTPVASEQITFSWRAVM